MKKWYMWLIFSGIWIIGGVINYFGGRSALGCLFAAAIFPVYAVLQYMADVKGKLSKKFLNISYLIVLLLAVCFVIFALFLL